MSTNAVKHGSATALQWQIVRRCPRQLVHHRPVRRRESGAPIHPHALHVAQVLGDAEHHVVGRILGDAEVAFCPFAVGDGRRLGTLGHPPRLLGSKILPAGDRGDRGEHHCGGGGRLKQSAPDATRPCRASVLRSGTRGDEGAHRLDAAAEEPLRILDQPVARAGEQQPVQQRAGFLIRRSLCPDVVRVPDPLQVGEEGLLLGQPLIERRPSLEQRLVCDLDQLVARREQPRLRPARGSGAARPAAIPLCERAAAPACRHRAARARDAARRHRAAPPSRRRSAPAAAP